MTDTLTELKRLHAEATPSPWEHAILATPLNEIGQYVAECVAASGGKQFHLIAVDDADVAHVGNGPRGDANAALIVAAVNALPRLLACVEALEVFAQAARVIDIDAPDDGEPSHGRGYVKAGDLRRARAALASLKGSA